VRIAEASSTTIADASIGSGGPTMPSDMFTGSAAVLVSGRSTLRLVRAHLHDILGASIQTLDSGTRLVASDLLVEHVSGELILASGIPWGSAFAIDQGSQASLGRVLVRDVSGPAIALGYGGVGTTATVRDLDVDSPNGGAIVLGQLGASGNIDLGRARIRGANDRAIVLRGTSSATIADVEVTKTMVISGTKDSGSAIAVLDVSQLRLSRFLVHDNANVGVIIDDARPTEAGLVMLRDGEIRGNAIGVQLLNGTLDVRRSLEDVMVDQNQQNLSAPP
jgi:hypothetical protein